MKFKVLFVGTALMAFSFTQVMNAQQAKGEPWTIPAEYKKMANPVAKDDASVKAGLTSYTRTVLPATERPDWVTDPREGWQKPSRVTFQALHSRLIPMGRCFTRQSSAGARCLLTTKKFLTRRSGV